MTDGRPDPRRRRLRAQGFDYAEPGAYLVTICVDRMEHRFGRIIEGRVRLNDAGSLVHDIWLRNPDRFGDVTLDAFIVMPNHLHGVLMLGSNSGGNSTSPSTVIQAFKSASTVEYGRGVKAGRFPKYERALGQRGFHDKILRDDRMLEAARQYIEGNPGRWFENHET